MVLVDTSVWIHHLHTGDRFLEKLLMDGDVVCHPHIIGELACGNLKNRNEILSLLISLPSVPQIEFDEFLFFIGQYRLSGRCIGFVDIHLLASAKLARVKLWTVDKRLRGVAQLLGLEYKKR
jgi:predicted nucleic acid-binding protein